MNAHEVGVLIKCKHVWTNECEWLNFSYLWHYYEFLFNFWFRQLLSASVCEQLRVVRNVDLILIAMFARLPLLYSWVFIYSPFFRICQTQLGQHVFTTQCRHWHRVNRGSLRLQLGCHLRWTSQMASLMAWCEIKYKAYYSRLIYIRICSLW